MRRSVEASELLKVSHEKSLPPSVSLEGRFFYFNFEVSYSIHVVVATQQSKFHFVRLLSGHSLELNTLFLEEWFKWKKQL